MTHRTDRAFLFAAGLAMAALCAASPASAFIRATLSATDATPLRWDLEETQQPLPAVAGGEIIYVIDTAGSGDIPGTAEMDAVARAFDHWEGIGTSRVAFSRGADQAIQVANNDNINAVYWAEGNTTKIGGTNENLDGFVSVTPTYRVASGANKGIILDANIILNGNDFSWTVTPESVLTSYDVEAVVTHEIGHLIGLDHSPVLSASMSPRFVAGEIRPRLLHEDDSIGASSIYPDGSFTTSTGSISGAVGRPAAVFGALVTVADSATGGIVSESISGTTGSYAAPGLPDGDYDTYVEPIDRLPPATTNLFDEADLGGYYGGDYYGSTVDPNFFASLPLLTTVTAPANTIRSFTVGTTAPGINISKIGGRASTIVSMTFRNAPTFLFQGESNILLGVAGPNLAGPVILELTGPGIIHNNSGNPIATGSVDGEASAIHSFTVDANAPLGLRSIIISSGGLGRTYATGAVEIIPNQATVLTAPGFWFTAPGEVNTTQDPITVTRNGDDIELDWSDVKTAHGYHVYRGTLAAPGSLMYNHQAMPGTVNGQCRVTTPHTVLHDEALNPTAVYYLVTAYNNAGEGHAGRSSSGVIRPAASPACTTP